MSGLLSNFRNTIIVSFVLALVIVLVCLIPVGTQIPAYASVSLLLVLLIAGIGQALYSYREQRHRVRYHSH